jgi:hypothetical protein
LGLERAGFRDWGLGCSLEGFDPSSDMSVSLQTLVHDFVFRALPSAAISRVKGLGVQGIGFRVEGFRVEGFRV